MRRLVTAQRPIVGMLRACGYSRRQVVLHYLAFGVVAGLAGGVLGAAAAIGLAGVVTQAYTAELSIPVTLTSISPLTAAIGVAFGLLDRGARGGAAGRARRRRVAAGRGDAPLRPGQARPPQPRRALVPPLRRLPVRWRMTLRAVGRNPRRSLSTILGVVLALTLVLVSWGMIDTTQILVDRQYGEIERQDAELYFRGALGPERAAAGPRSAGRRRSRAGARPAGLAARRTAAATRPPSKASQRGHRRCTASCLAGGGTTTLPADGLLAGQALGGKLGIEAGEEVEVTAPGTGASAARPGRAFLEEPLGTYVYAALGPIRRLAGPRLGLGNVALVRYAPGADREAMRRRLSALPGVVAFVDSKALIDTSTNTSASSTPSSGSMLLFGAAMAFALLYNSIQANLAERSVEVATLRAAGMPFRTLSRMITAENFLVTAIGIVPGLIVGVEVSRLFLASFASDSFTFDLQVSDLDPRPLRAGDPRRRLLSELPGLRAVKKLDIAASFASAPPDGVRSVFGVLFVRPDLAQDPLQARLLRRCRRSSSRRRPPGGSRRSARASPGRRRGRWGGPRGRSAARSGASPRGR